MQQKQRWIWGAGVPLLLLVASILPRTIALGALTNPDELRWLERSVSFYDALGRGDWAATLEAFHPGIVPAWGFGSLLTARFGLAQLRAWQAADALPMADLARTALLFPTILSAVTVLASYGLMRRLAGREAAFYGALLLAVEPYYLAFTHAIHLDLTQASFMALAALLWLNYLHGPRHWLFLVGSGIAGAMAVLTRTGALYLVPYSLLALVLYSLAAKPSGEKLQFVKDWLPSIGRAALAWGAWFAVLALTTFVLWPALWVQPLQALGQLRGGILRSLENPHATPVYFLGEVMSRDPGILYYALILLFRLRPATLLLSALSPVALVLAWRRTSSLQRAAWLSGLAYPLFYLLQMSLATHKLERYLMPLIPALCLLAGVSLRLIVQGARRWLADRRQPRSSALLQPGLVGAVMLVLALPWLRLAPTYAAYYDPLVGGGDKARELFIVGGGEGLDMAAAYLNEKAGAEDLWALSYYPEVFMYYFVGHTQSPNYGSWSGLPVAADYVVLTSSEVQRDIYPTTLDFFVPREPEYTVRINGIDYAWVYPVPRKVLDAPPPIGQPMDANFEHRVHLIGYDTEHSGSELHLALYWKLIVSVHEELQVMLKLLDSQGQVVAEQSDPPWSGDVAVLSWPEGLAVRDEHAMPLPDQLQPGDYTLVLSLHQRDENGQERLLKLEGDGGTEVRLGPIALGAQ